MVEYGVERGVPTLVLIDIQREYVAKGRPFYLDGIEPSLENCRRLLAHARERAWPIAHVRHLGAAQLFSDTAEWSRFIEGFEPWANEMVFTKRKLSCFSSEEFSRVMEAARQGTVYVAGYNAQMCCLSTVVDAHHRGLRLKFVKDASWCRAMPSGSEREAYPWIVDTIGIYADLVDTSAVLDDASGRLSEPARPERRRASPVAAE